MRVLLPIIYHELTKCIERAFQEEGHEVRVVDWRKYSRQPAKVEALCIEQARQFNPDFAFCQFQSPGMITHKFPEVLKDIGCFSVNWTGDVRAPLPQWYVDLAPYFSVTAFSNMTDVDALRKMGYRSEHVQIGYDDRIYNSDGTAERSGAVFIGNNYGGYKYSESESRRQMVKLLEAELGDRFKVYGMPWPNGFYLSEPDDAKILREAAVAINWDHFHRPWFASDRLLRATACGCATVSQHYEGLSTEHPSVVGVNSPEDVVKAVRLLLDNPNTADKVGKISAIHTKNNHLWNNRVKQMTAWV